MKVNKGQKLAVIIDAAKELLKRGSWCGETHLQKAIFILQELTVADTGFDFILYKHGPFSFELRDAITELAADGLIEYVVRNPDYGPSLLPTADSDVFLQRFPKTLSKYSDQIGFVADQLNDMRVNDLERLTTAVFILKRFKQLEGADRAREITRLKPHISMPDAQEAVSDAEKLIARANSLSRSN